MKRLCALLVSLMAAAPLTATAAPEFPPGTFSDGAQYSVDDFAGKVLVLIFYEQNCPKCRAAVPDYNALAAEFADQPVYVLGVAAEDTEQQAASYLRSTRMQIPLFVDNAGLLSDAYDFDISLRNIRQIAIVAPDGDVRRAGYQIDRARGEIQGMLDEAAWTFDRADYPPLLEPVLRDLELGNWQTGLARLRSAERSRDEAVKAAYTKLMTHAEAEMDALLAEATSEMEAQRPAHAYVLFEEAAASFGVFEAKASEARKQMRELRGEDAVKQEMAARGRYQQLIQGVRRATPAQAGEVRNFAQQLLTEFPNTPTADRVNAWLNPEGD